MGSNLVQTVKEASLTIVVSPAASARATQTLVEAGATVVVAAGRSKTARIKSALEQLGASGVTSLLLEGGPRLASAFLRVGELDEFRTFIAP